MNLIEKFSALLNKLKEKPFVALLSVIIIVCTAAAISIIVYAIIKGDSLFIAFVFICLITIAFICNYILKIYQSIR
jgi:hypothetical protein